MKKSKTVVKNLNKQEKKKKHNKCIKATILFILLIVCLVLCVNFERSSNNQNNQANNQNKNETTELTNKSNKSKNSKISKNSNKINDNSDYNISVYNRMGYAYANERVEFYSEKGYIHKIIETVTYNVDNYKADKEKLSNATIDEVLNNIKKNSCKVQDMVGYNVQYKRAKDKKTITRTTVIDFEELEQSSIKKLKRNGVINVSVSAKKEKRHSYISLKETQKFYKDMGYEQIN